MWGEARENGNEVGVEGRALLRKQMTDHNSRAGLYPLGRGAQNLQGSTEVKPSLKGVTPTASCLNVRVIRTSYDYKG